MSAEINPHCSSHRYRRDARSFDEDEDMWLNEDEEEEDVTDAALDKCKSDYGKFMESEKGICAAFLWASSLYLLLN